jgi:hypothetical protein
MQMKSSTLYFPLDLGPDDGLRIQNSLVDFLAIRTVASIKFHSNRAVSHDGVGVGAGTTDFCANQHDTGNQFYGQTDVILAFADCYAEMMQVLEDIWSQDGAQFFPS